MTARPIPSYPPVAASDIGLLLLLTLGWGINWPLMKIALGGISLWTFRAFCVAAGAICLLGLGRMAGQRIGFHPRALPMLALISFFNITAWNVLALYGISHMPSGRASVIAFTMPLWAILLGRFVLQEKIDTWKGLGLLLGLAGLALLLVTDLASITTGPGGLLMLGAAVSWAIGTALFKRFPLPIGGIVNTGWQMAIGGLPIVVGAVIIDWDRTQDWAPGPVFALIYNMFVCFVFCYWAWMRMVTRTPVAVAGLSTLMIPVVGTLSGMLMLGERPSGVDMAGLALIVGALICVLVVPQILNRRGA